MNNKKENIKKMAVFVSALSFIAVSNYNVVNSISAEVIAGQTAKVNEAETDETVQDNTEAPETDNNNGDSNTSEPSDSDNEEDDSQNTDISDDDDEVVKEKSDITVGLSSNENKDKIVDKIREDGYSAELKDEYNNIFIIVTVEYKPEEKDTAKEALESYIENFKYEYEENGILKVYKYNNNAIVSDTYYAVNFENNIEWLKSNAITLQEYQKDNIYTYNGKTFLKSGTNLTQGCFDVKLGYGFSDKNMHLQVNDIITVKNDCIYTNGNIFEIQQYKMNITFTLNGVEVKYGDSNVESIELNVCDLGSEEITFISQNSRDIKVNDKVINLDENNSDENNRYFEKTVQLNELIQVENVNHDYQNYPLKVTAIKKQVELTCYFGDDEKKITFDVTSNEAMINIPYIYKLDGKNYYISKISENNYPLATYDTFNGSHGYYEKVSYNEDLQINYTLIEEDDSYDGSDLTSVIASAVSAVKDNEDKDILYRKSDNVLCFITPVLNVGIDLSTDLANKKIYSVNQDFRSLLNSGTNEDGCATISVNKDDKFIKIFSVLNTSDDTVKSLPLSSPVYLYIDNKKPVVESKNDEEAPEWSNEKNTDGQGMYRFSFSINDSETIPEGASNETREAYNQINRNDNLSSIDSVTVGGIEFKKSNGSWLATDASVNERYDITLEADYESDKNGSVTGIFNAVLTLKSGENLSNYLNETINIVAKDKSGNVSNTLNQPVKIDVAPPVVESIHIPDLTENLYNQQVLVSFENRINLSDIKVADDCSGIKNIVYYYGDTEINNYSALTENTGKIKIVVTDNAGNDAVYYYVNNSEANNVTAIEAKATDIVVDSTLPDNPNIVVRPPDYSDNSDPNNIKNWYRNYPETTFNLVDHLSGINNIYININGTEKVVTTEEIISSLVSFNIITDGLTKEEIGSLLYSGHLGIRFETETDNQTFTAYLAYGDTNIIMLSEHTLGADGRLSIEIIAEDFAKNKGIADDNNTYSVTLYIDNNTPEALGSFEVNQTNNGENALVRHFGTFTNKPITITVPFKEEYASSGIKDSTIRFAGKKYEGRIDFDKKTVSFNIPESALAENSNIKGEFTFNIKDNVDNEITAGFILKNSEANSEVVIENIKPVISSKSVKGDNEYKNSNNEVWYSSDVNVTYKVIDEQSGLLKVDCTRSPMLSVENSAEYSFDKVNDEQVFVMETDSSIDGKYDFKINVYDNAGNNEFNEFSVYKDVTKPYISGFDFNYNNADKLSGISLNIVKMMSEKFQHFFDNASVMTVAAKDDRGASAGVKAISCVLYNTDGSEFISYTSENPNYDGNGVYSADFLVPEGFKGDIKAWVVDNVKNVSDTESPDGLASENQQRHDSTSVLSIELPQTEYTDTNSLPLYNNDVTVAVTVDDGFSGIRNIEWLTSDFDGWRSVSVDADGNMYGNIDGWNIDRNERNIAVLMSNNITVSNDANNNFIRVRITDNSGNVSEDEVRFSIDKQAPVISVSGLEASQGKQYYNSNKNAHIVITERNFNAPVINGSVDSGFTEDENSPRETDAFRHFKDILYDTDGEYSLDIESTDLAGNIGAKYSSGVFVIDKTDPVMNVEFSKQSGGKVDPSKSEYIDDVIKAVISVEEVNFDSGRIKININGEAFTPEEWKENNGKHTAEIPFDEFKKDGEYSVSVSGTDLANNVFKTYSANFVIDTESPEISFSGFDSANKGDVAPVINISDKNLDDYSITVLRNGKLCEMSYDSENEVYKFAVSDKDDYITGKWSEKTVSDEKVKEFVFDGFSSEECFDGSYVISVTALDKAENELSETAAFSVNRFGSVFAVEEVDKLDGKYLNKAPNVVITETNVDKHKEDSEVIVIIDKGSATEQVDESMYEISEPEMLDDKSGYEYKYTIKAANFNQDLDYKISIQSVDEAGNKNVSTNRGADIGFSIDTHDPEFKCDELVERAEFRESEKSFRINVNEKLQHITVTTNIGETLLDFDADDDKNRNDNSYTFIMPASNSSRSVTVELTDLAGNKTIETYNNLLVTENIFLYLIHKAWVKVAGGIAVLGLGAVGSITFASKKKRKRTR